MFTVLPSPKSSRPLPTTIILRLTSFSCCDRSVRLHDGLATGVGEIVGVRVAVDVRGGITVCVGVEGIGVGGTGVAGT